MTPGQTEPDPFLFGGEVITPAGSYTPYEGNYTNKKEKKDGK